ncbi:MAG: pitrilysin family protein [Aliishimia sp.]
MMRITAAVFAMALAIPATADVDIQEITSPGGLTSWLVEEPAIPFIALEVRFKGGGSLDLPGKRGAISLMTSLLEEGAADLDARGFARAKEGMAASFGYSVSDDGLTVTARFLTENSDDAVDLLRNSLVAPRFDEEAVERVRQQLLSNIRSDDKDPDTLARRAFDVMAYGAEHPYGSSIDGTAESITGLTRDDLITAHRNLLVKDRVDIGVVGDIDPEALGAMLDKLLGDLPTGGAALPSKVDVSIKGGVTVVPYDTPQSVAIFGHSGIDRDDDDFFAAFLLNHVLGAGGFESRLMTEVREKRGLTYGVYSYLAPKDFAATYQGSVASQNDRIGEAITVIGDEWRKIATDGVTAKELADAKLFLTGAYPLRFDGNSNIASILVGMQSQDLPIDYIATRNDKVNAVTMEDVTRVAKRIYQPENLHFVVVGKPVGLSTSAGN